MLGLHRSLDWRKRDTWEVRSQWVTVELENTESTQVVEVSLVVCITKESTSINSKWNQREGVLKQHTLPHPVRFKPFIYSLYSHPGFFGKLGMRKFHFQNNLKFCPVVNTDKLWSLVSEKTRTAAEKSKDKSPVIDVTKSVSFFQLFSTFYKCFIFIIWYEHNCLLNRDLR